MQTCRLLHCGTGLNEIFDGVIINGRTYIKAKSFFGSALAEEKNAEWSGSERYFWDKTEFDEFKRENPTGWKFTEKEDWERIAEYYEY